MAAVQRKKRPMHEILKDLQAVDKLFAELEKDKSLPTFGEFFLCCLIGGTAQEVNLKTMYPKVHRKLTNWLKQHKTDIVKNQITKGWK